MSKYTAERVLEVSTALHRAAHSNGARTAEAVEMLDYLAELLAKPAAQGEAADGGEQTARALFGDTLRAQRLHEDAYRVIRNPELTPYDKAAINAIRVALSWLRREEADHANTIDQRDYAEDALSDAFRKVTGREPEWSSAWTSVDAVIEIAEAAAANRASVTAWQPIETAPKDGTVVLVLLEGSDVPQSVRFRVGMGWTIAWDDYLIVPHDGPICWMPCPGVSSAPQPKDVEPLPQSSAPPALYQHDDGRYALALGDVARQHLTYDDPGWHRVPLDVVVTGAEGEKR